MSLRVPPLPLPDERAEIWLEEDRHIRLLSEAILGLLCLPIGWLSLVPLRGNLDLPGLGDIAFVLAGLAPLIFVASMRAPSTYLLTSHRLALVIDGRISWSVRYDQIARIRRFGGTLHLRGPGNLTYSVSNLRHAIWLEHHLRDRTGL